MELKGADQETRSTQRDTVSLELTLKYIRLKDGFEAKHWCSLQEALL